MSLLGKLILEKPKSLGIRNLLSLLQLIIREQRHNFQYFHRIKGWTAFFPGTFFKPVQPLLKSSKPETCTS